MMPEIRSREPVLLAENFTTLVEWYRDVLGFTITQTFESDFHYCNLESVTGVKLGIGSASEAGVKPGDKTDSTLILQIEVDDVRDFFAYLESKGTRITGGPSYDSERGFWFGSFADPEGNPWWVVDANCP